MKLCLAGKGGSGKTSISGYLARFMEDGYLEPLARCLEERAQRVHVR
jgi:CO dehydrogenase nickel-insertion accessory protein CooC1